MGEYTNISWTDHTFNPWWGCTKVSAGCDHCYAEAFDKRTGGSHWGKDQPRRVFADKHWNEPLKWDRLAASLGIKRKVFCASMADVMDDEAPEGQRERLWKLIDATPNLIWQLLTKRPQRYDRYLPQRFEHGNVWLGISAEDQANYDLRWPILWQAVHQRDQDKGYDIPVLWISYEPALGPLELKVHRTDCYPDWVICGGESGQGHRAFAPMWGMELLKQCGELGVAFFMKQMSASTPTIGKGLIPVALNVQEFPHQ